MTDFDFERPPNMSTPDGVRLAEWLSRQFLKVSNSFIQVSGALIWRGLWVSGSYEANDLVVDSGWLSAANKTTTTKPAPVPTGDIRNIIDVPGPPTFANNSVSSGSLIVGVRYAYAEDLYIREARFYVPAAAVGLRASAWLVLDPDTDPTFQVIFSSQVIDASETGKWISIPIGLTLVQEGRTFDVILAFTPTTGAITFTHEWNYRRSNQNPQSGEITHKSAAAADTVLVHKQDSGGTDRSTDLDNVGPGSEMEMLANGYFWTILNASKAGDIYTLTVAPSVRAPAGTSNFSFSYFAPITINYVEALNHYSTLAEVNGFISTGGYNPIDSPPTLNQDAYGIDIQVQGVFLSGDWDYLAFSN